MSMKFIAVIADIVKSREIENREDVQNRLRHILQEVNRASTGTVSPYTITLGDEFQAVYKEPENIVSEILEIVCKMYPIQIRFSIGHDEIHTALNIAEAIGMDGPAFHIARDGLTKCKRYKHTVIQIAGRERGDFSFINASLSLTCAHLSDWKEHTIKIFSELYHGRKVREMEEDFAISGRGIYKNIENNKLHSYVRYFRELEQELKRMIETC